MAEPLVWHGAHEVPEGHMIGVTIGPLVLALARRPGEWRIGWYRDDLAKGTSPGSSVSPPTPITDPEEAFTVQRFLTRRPGDSIHLRPLLADRPIVTRPEVPLVIPAGDEVKIFVSTPVWVRAELLQPERPLLELPTSRPSDTWFGPNTRRGVVAYASQTAARLGIDNLPILPHRAITRIMVRNQAGTSLNLERLSVPAPNLALFADREGALWTSPLLVERDSESAPARVKLDDEPPAEADGAKEVARPRNPERGNVLSRALHVLIG